ncbi:hypothetical protein CFK41_02480 [Brachybacterium ginsengisoli]|uniref:Asparagine synthetase domain-containing protein n=1 Tax=Brachybacterium ginsengisoli TaxID=1331682 RepID=A0A291GU98_9MICO|nr:hypothetical protein [Brachybacterium ginsengisoli]ATG53768.1 hypothetical protein CFK41_02480 [Brachybacterium ginsengisoli]
MRLFVGIRVKNDVPRSERGPLRDAVRAAYAALGAVQPWPEENTTQDLRWVPSEGRVATIFRSNEEPPIRERDGWIGNKARCWSWTGIMGGDLHARLRSSTAATADDEAIWSGIGSFALLGATPDALVAYTNQHRSESVYWISTPTAVVVSNSAALLATMRGNGTPEYSRVGTAAFLMHGLPFADATPFEGVRTLDAAAKLSSDERTDLRITYDEVEQDDSAADVSATAETIAQGLVDYAKVLASGSGEVAAAITGGKDSRLVVSTLHAAGIDFSTYTNGLPESGEAAVGTTVTGALGVEHKLVTPPVRRSAGGAAIIEAKPELQAWTTLRSTGGMGNAFTMLPDPSRPHLSTTRKTNFGGQGGEIIRGGFARELGETPSSSDAVSALTSRWFNNKDLLTPLAAEAVRADIQGYLDFADRDPVRATFLAYVTNRTGRWLATMRHGESVTSSHTTLLINNQMVRLLRTLPSRMLLGERIAHEVMATLAPEVVDLPFFRDRWAFEKKGPDPMYKPESWDDRAPYSAHDQPRAGYNWRSAYNKPLASYFKEFVLSQEKSLLFDLIDRTAVAEMFDGKRYRAPAAWALFSSQFMADGRWLEASAPSAATIEIEIPA